MLRTVVALELIDEVLDFLGWELGCGIAGIGTDCPHCTAVLVNRGEIIAKQGKQGPYVKRCSRPKRQRSIVEPQSKNETILWTQP
jgi:hypothetical protein